MQKRGKYGEGTWFAIPLTSGGYAVGIVARAHKGMLLCYFFGPARDSVPALSEVKDLKARDALCAFRVSDLGLEQDEWPIIGDSPFWERKNWPMPVFGFKNPITGRMWRRYYSEDNPSRLLREEPAPADTVLESSAGKGHKSAEWHITERLVERRKGDDH